MYYKFHVLNMSTKKFNIIQYPSFIMAAHDGANYERTIRLHNYSILNELIVQLCAD